MKQHGGSKEKTDIFRQISVNYVMHPIVNQSFVSTIIKGEEMFQLAYYSVLTIRKQRISNELVVFVYPLLRNQTT